MNNSPGVVAPSTWVDLFMTVMNNPPIVTRQVGLGELFR